MTFTRQFSAAVIDFQEMEFGYVYGNLEPAVVFLANGIPQLIPDPMSYGTMAPIDPSLTGVSSIALAPGADIDDPWALIYADANGLTRKRGTKLWTFANSELLLTGTWADAEDLRYEPFGGEEHIFGLDSTRTTLKSAYPDSTGSYQDLFDHTFAYAIQDYAIVDWDNDGAADTSQEVALLTSEWLFVVDINLVTKDLTFLAAIRVSTTSTSYDEIESLGTRIALVTEDSSGDPVLRVLYNGGYEPDVPLSFPVTAGGSPQDFELSAMTAGDIDADGDVDIVMTDRASLRAICMLNDGDTFDSTVQGTDYESLLLDELNPTQSGAANEAAPLIVDLNVDDKDDALFLLDSVPELKVATEFTTAGGDVTVNPTDPGVQANETSYWIADSDCLAGIPPPQAVCIEGTLNLAWRMPNNLITNYGHIQATLWRQDNTASYLTPSAVYNRVFALPSPQSGGTTSNVYIKLPVNEETGTWGSTNEHYYVRYRLVNLDSSGNIDQVSQSRAVGLNLNWEALQATNPDLPVIFSHLESLAPLQGVIMQHLSDPGGGDGDSVGAIYSSLVPPPPPPGVGMAAGQVESIVQPANGYWL